MIRRLLSFATLFETNAPCAHDATILSSFQLAPVATALLVADACPTASPEAAATSAVRARPAVRRGKARRSPAARDYGGCDPCEDAVTKRRPVRRAFEVDDDLFFEIPVAPSSAGR